MKPFRTGVVIGKFYPPHRGHHLLVNAALAQCEHVAVLVCWKPGQTDPSRSAYPRCGRSTPRLTYVP
jgi:cytidyltransferase-like protein